MSNAAHRVVAFVESPLYLNTIPPPPHVSADSEPDYICRTRVVLIDEVEIARQLDRVHSFDATKTIVKPVLSPTQVERFSAFWKEDGVSNVEPDNYVSFFIFAFVINFLPFLQSAPLFRSSVADVSSASVTSEIHNFIWVLLLLIVCPEQEFAFSNVNFSLNSIRMVS